MSKRVEIIPGRIGAWILWLGCSHYGLKKAVKMAPYSLPKDTISKVYRIESNSLIGLDFAGNKENHKYAIEFKSDGRDCLLTLSYLPRELEDIAIQRTNMIGAFFLFLKACLREPSAIIFPLAIPFTIVLFMNLFGIWNEYVLHNRDVLSFFSSPGCDTNCVRKVLSIHSLVALLFLLQLLLLILPMGLLFFQAPKYKSSFNYRIVQTYSIAAMAVGAFIFVQLVVFFPFKQYGKFLELGFDPKVEKMLNNLKKTK